MCASQLASHIVPKRSNDGAYCNHFSVPAYCVSLFRSRDLCLQLSLFSSIDRPPLLWPSHRRTLRHCLLSDIDVPGAVNLLRCRSTCPLRPLWRRPPPASMRPWPSYPKRIKAVWLPSSLLWRSRSSLSPSCFGAISATPTALGNETITSLQLSR